MQQMWCTDSLNGLIPRSAGDEGLPFGRLDSRSIADRSTFLTPGDIARVRGWL